MASLHKLYCQKFESPSYAAPFWHYIFLDPGGLRGDRHGDGHPGRAPRLRGVPNHPMRCVASRGPVGLVGLGGAVPTMLVGLMRDGCRAGEGGGQGPDHC